MRSADTGLANELALAMTRLRARLRLESAPQGAAWTWSQVTTLMRIIAEGPCTVAQLAQAEHVRPQSMAESVAALRREGLVAGSQDPGDRRKVRLEATEEGRALAAAIPALREAWLQAAITAALGEDERAQLGAAVLLINRLADWPGGEPGFSAT
jgi:DNA-binding MarR family transcriptional regulator